jgi:hypothetical protein
MAVPMSLSRRRGSRRQALVITLLLSVTSAAGSRVAAAQTSGPRPAGPTAGKRPAEDPAAAAKREGDEAMDALRYDDAIAAYTRAYESFGMPAALYNRGRVHQARGEYVLAADDIERFAREATPELRARVPELDALLTELHGKIAVLSVVTNVQNARILVRSAEVGTTPLATPVRLAAGTARVEVVAPGYQPYVRDVELPGGQSLTVTATLVTISDRGVLVVRSSTVPGAVTVDGRSVGDAPVEVQLPAGTHQLSMHRDGYTDATTSTVIAVGERKEVSMRLETTPSIFARWWFWTGVGVVVTGGVVLTVALLTEKSADKGDGFEPQQTSAPLMRW